MKRVVSSLLKLPLRMARKLFRLAVPWLRRHPRLKLWLRRVLDRTPLVGTRFNLFIYTSYFSGGVAHIGSAEEEVWPFQGEENPPCWLSVDARRVYRQLAAACSGSEKSF